MVCPLDVSEIAEAEGSVAYLIEVSRGFSELASRLSSSGSGRSTEGLIMFLITFSTGLRGLALDALRLLRECGRSQATAAWAASLSLEACALKNRIHDFSARNKSFAIAPFRDTVDSALRTLARLRAFISRICDSASSEGVPGPAVHVG